MNYNIIFFTFIDTIDDIDETKRFPKPKLFNKLPDLNYESEDEETNFLKKLEVNLNTIAKKCIKNNYKIIFKKMQYSFSETITKNF